MSCTYIIAANTLAVLSKHAFRQDIFEAVSRLEVLGSGFRVVKDKSLVISQPHELNADHISVFSSAKVHSKYNTS